MAYDKITIMVWCMFYGWYVVFTSCSDNDKVSFLMEHPAIFLHK